MRFFSTALFCLVAIGSAWAQPTLTGVTNAANYSAGIAQGSIFVAFGTNMGPASIVQASAFPVPTTLAGTSMRFTPVGGGTFYDALIAYTLAGQIAGIVPSQTPVGDYNVTVTYNNSTSAPLRVAVVSRNFALVSLAGSGTGPAVIQNFVAGATVLPINQFGAPARPGQTLILYGTGMGPIASRDDQPPGLQDLKGPTNLRVFVGDVEIDPIYAGRSPGSPGLDQINLTLPTNVTLGCTVPLRIRVAGAFTNSTTTVAIAPDGASICTHPLYSAEALRRLDARGTLTYGSFAVAAQSIRIEVPIIGTTTIKSESVSGEFSTVSLSNIADVTDSNTAGLFVNLGSCSVSRVRADQSGQVVGGTAKFLDAGTALTLNGPGITNKAVPKPAPGVNVYFASLGDPTGGLFPGIVIPGQTPSAGITAGNFTLAGNGGTEVGAFSASLRVPAPIVWTNQASFSTVIRSSGLTVNWTGGEATDIVTIFGISGVRAGGTTENPIFDTSAFICTAKGDARTFSVPAAVLSQLAPSTGSLLDGTGVGVLALQQTTSSEANGRFSAPLRAGGNIDLGIFTYAIGGLSTVTWR